MRAGMRKEVRVGFKVRVMATSDHTISFFVFDDVTMSLLSLLTDKSRVIPSYHRVLSSFANVREFISHLGGELRSVNHQQKHCVRC